MAQRLGRREPAIGSAQHHVEELIAGFVHGDFALQQPGRVDVDVLAQGPHRARIGADIDNRQDRIADDIALSGREQSGQRNPRLRKASPSAAAESGIRRIALSYNDVPVELRLSQVNTARHEYWNELGRN